MRAAIRDGAVEAQMLVLPVSSEYTAVCAVRMSRHAHITPQCVRPGCCATVMGKSKDSSAAVLALAGLGGCSARGQLARARSFISIRTIRSYGAAWDGGASLLVMWRCVCWAIGVGQSWRGGKGWRNSFMSVRTMCWSYTALFSGSLDVQRPALCCFPAAHMRRPTLRSHFASMHHNQFPSLPTNLWLAVAV